MQFTKFKKIFLTYGICEIDFSFIDNKNRLIRIENYSHENGKITISENATIIGDSCAIYYTKGTGEFKNLNLIEGELYKMAMKNMELLIEKIKVK